MGNLSGTEILVIMFLALIILGPDKLPEAASKIGKAIGEFKRVAGGYQAELKSAVDQVTEPIKSTMTSFTSAVNDNIGTGMLVPTILTPTNPSPAVTGGVIDATATGVPATDAAATTAETPRFDGSGESAAIVEEVEPRREMPTTWLPHLMQQAPATPADVETTTPTDTDADSSPVSEPIVVVVPTVSSSDSISFS